jgi:hypothetical protein
MGRHWGDGMVARLLDLERDMLALLERELPEADAERRAAHAWLLAQTIATNRPWFEEIVRERPAKVAKALTKVHRAARDLLKAFDELPPAGTFGMHMRLLWLDLPPSIARRALLGELVHGTIRMVGAGLNSRRAAVAEIALTAAETREGMLAVDRGKHQANRLVRQAADTYEMLKGEAVPVSGSGEGPYYDMVCAVLKAADLRDASYRDVARREAERRRAAPHSGTTSR